MGNSPNPYSKLSDDELDDLFSPVANIAMILEMCLRHGLEVGEHDVQAHPLKGGSVGYTIDGMEADSWIEHMLMD